MWYGGSYNRCERNQQSREAFSVIQHLGLSKETTFKNLRELGINSLMCARILHLLSNPDFGVENYVEE